MPPINNNLTSIITDKLNNIQASPLHVQNAAITQQRVNNDQRHIQHLTNDFDTCYNGILARQVEAISQAQSYST